MASKLDNLLKKAEKNNILKENEEKVQEVKEVKVEQPAAETKPAEPEPEKQVSVEQAQVAAEEPAAEAEKTNETTSLKELFKKPLPTGKSLMVNVKIPEDIHRVISTLANAGNVSSITNLYVLILREFLAEHEKEVNKLIIEQAKKNLFKL